MYSLILKILLLSNYFNCVMYPEKAMATHSSVLAWRIPGTVEPGGLLAMGSHRVRHDWSDLAAAAVLCVISCYVTSMATHCSYNWLFPTFKHAMFTCCPLLPQLHFLWLDTIHLQHTDKAYTKVPPSSQSSIHIGSCTYTYKHTPTLYLLFGFFFFSSEH